MTKPHPWPLSGRRAIQWTVALSGVTWSPCSRECARSDVAARPAPTASPLSHRDADAGAAALSRAALRVARASAVPAGALPRRRRARPAVAAARGGPALCPAGARPAGSLHARLAAAALAVGSASATLAVDAHQARGSGRTDRVAVGVRRARAADPRLAHLRPAIGVRLARAADAADAAQARLAVRGCRAAARAALAARRRSAAALRVRRARSTDPRD